MNIPPSGWRFYFRELWVPRCLDTSSLVPCFPVSFCGWWLPAAAGQVFLTCLSSGLQRAHPLTLNCNEKCYRKQKSRSFSFFLSPCSLSSMRETNVFEHFQDFQENVSVEGLFQVCGVCTCEPSQVAPLQLSLHFLCPHHSL